MPLTTDELIEMRGYLQIGANPDVFTDAQLQTFFTRGGSTFAGAMVYAITMLLAEQTKKISYTIGATSVSRTSIRDGLKELLRIWERRAGMSGGGPLFSGAILTGIDQTEES